MTKELRALIKSEISTIVDNVFFVEAPQSQPYPYIVFELQLVQADYIKKKSYMLECNFWFDTTYADVEDVADELDAMFESYKYIDDKIEVCIYNGSIRQEVADENKDLKRIRRTYEVYAYERG